MKKMILALCLFSFGAVSKANESNSVKELSNGNRILSVGSSLLLGFGSGPGIQGRFSPRGWIYGSTQAAGLLMLISTMGSSPNEDRNKKDKIATIGSILFFSSRAIEILDTSYYAITYFPSVRKKKKIKKIRRRRFKKKRKRVSFGVIPMIDGAYASVGLSF